jgi:hypothetical protein
VVGNGSPKNEGIHGKGDEMMTKPKEVLAENDGDINCDFELPTIKKRRDARNDPPQKSRSTPTAIRVDRIDGETTTTELKRLFKRFGHVIEIGIFEARNGDRTVMSATVVMDDLYAALEAERLLDGFELRGLPIKVSMLGA